ncbi:MAG TPA: 2-oxoacid:acceptor oxidoreductase family protein [Bacteroidia bacterium]|nr:2-oxoacid:acceptor oxidoreductase family protein [Bacteroidia bacterium]
MITNKKILIAGVGGQGIVYLTNIIVETAMLSDIPVSVSEIHGLSQRGGIVTAGIGLGKYCTGFTGKANIDFLFGLEPLETQRCLPWLHKNSSVIFGDYRISPYAVNAQTAAYPDVISFAEYLGEQCKEVVFIKNFPENIDPILYNIFLLGRATRMKDFPFSVKKIEEAIQNTVTEYQLEKTYSAFREGMEFNSVIQPV